MPRQREPASETAVEVLVIGAGVAGVATVEEITQTVTEPDRSQARDRPLRAVLVDGASAGAGGWSGRLAVAALQEAGAQGLDWVSARDHLRAVRRGVVQRHEARIRTLQGRWGPRGLVLPGRARLAGSGRVLVEALGVGASAGGRAFRARRIVLATGCRPVSPEVAGLAETAYLTAEDLSEFLALEPRPATVAVLGAGSTGCALAQAIARLGVTVTLVDERRALLPGMDPDAGAIVAAALRRDGVRLVLGSPVVTVAPTLDGGAWLGTAAGIDVAAERLLVTTGWRAAAAGLDLPAAGVAVDASGGVRVDTGLATTAAGILAAGGVVGGEPHAGVAVAMGAVAGANAVARRPSVNWSANTVAALTLTDPEVASVGLAHPGAGRGDPVQVGTVRWSEIDRAVLSGAGHGFVRVLLAAVNRPHGRWPRRRSASEDVRVVGATVVGDRAGDLVAPLALAIGTGLPAATVAAAVSADPTWSSALRLAVARARSAESGVPT